MNKGNKINNNKKKKKMNIHFKTIRIYFEK